MNRTVRPAFWMSIAAGCAILGGLAASPALRAAPVTEGTCGQMQRLYDPATLWYGKIVGEDFSFDREHDFGRSLNRVRCFTTQPACRAWLRDMANRRSRVTFVGCSRGGFPRYSEPLTRY